LVDPEEAEDDEWFPHPFGGGVCGEKHFKDEVTEEGCVRVRVIDSSGEGKEREEVRRLVSGEGIAIGRMPCEFHREEYGF
jgi:cell division control protein 7